METVEEKIDRFQNYNQTMIAAALAEANRRHQGLPAKLLLCSIFDSLSIAAFPSENSVGKRYRETISKHSCWAYHNNVSLLQLCGVLEDIAQLPNEFSQFKDWVQDEKAKRFPISKRLVSNHKSLVLELDPTLPEVLREWPCLSNDSPDKLNGKFLPYMFTHKNLLWKYRNKLAHEFRLPGSGAESVFRRESEPYYQEVSTVSDIVPVDGLIFRNRWELIYPTDFFAQIAKSALESICSEYRNSCTSPFLSYQEGGSWL